MRLRIKLFTKHSGDLKPSILYLILTDKLSCRNVRTRSLGKGYTPTKMINIKDLYIMINIKDLN